MTRGSFGVSRSFNVSRSVGVLQIGRGLLLTVLCCVTSLVQAAIDIHMDSELGDWVGQGQFYQFTDTDSTITLNSVSDRVAISVSQASPYNYWNFQFKTPADLATGGYFEALRYPFQGPLLPGLSVSGNGRGCNQLTGHFVIFALSIVNNVIEELALDFVQYCDGSGSPLSGTIRVNSTVPVPVDTPIAYAGRDQIVDEGSVVQLSGELSYSALSTGQVSHSWQQVMGPNVILSTPSQAVTSFTAPGDVPLGGVDLVFEDTVTDDYGSMASDSVLVHVQSKSDPHTFLNMYSEAGDYIGQGLDWSDNLNSALFTLNPNYDNGVSVRVTASNTWSLDFAPPQGVDLAVGEYQGATRFPFQAADVPGLSVSGYGRGCNTLTGWFKVLGLDSSAAPGSFAATFEQHCEGGVPALTGTIAVNYVDPSVPSADAGLPQTVQETDTVTLTGSGTDDINGGIVAYHWTQLSGPTVTLSNPDSAMTTFQAPIINDSLNEDYLEFELVVVDNLGFKAAAQVTITVQQKPVPPTPPVAKDDEFKVYKNQLAVLNVLANDRDDQGLNPGSVKIVTPPKHGTATVQADGSIAYQPDPGFQDGDTLKYTVADIYGTVSNVAKVSIEVLNK